MRNVDIKHSLSNTPKEQRNIIDHYHYWKHEAILADLDSKRHNFSILCCNLGNDFNISSTIRNSNAFLAKEVIIWGSKNYDRRGAVGTQNYTHFKHFKEESLDSLVEYIGDSEIIGIDNESDSLNIISFEWPKKHFIMAFGQEQIGLPKEVKALCKNIVYIPQYGSVRSLNVACASAVVMYDFCCKMKS
jgi:tRNA G18 (ribose-2'-O)-methylase SpoU